MEIADEPYEHRGILNSEMALIIHTCKRLGVERVVESGRARGQSTYLLGKYLPECVIYSIEGRDTEDEAFARKRVSSLRNVQLCMGDGEKVLPLICSSWQHRTAVLCDGPKGHKAIAVLERCFEHKHVMVGFIHDMRRLDHGGPSPYRAAAEAAFKHHKFSDDPEFVAAAGWMDQKVIEANGPVGPAHEAEFGSYGPTIGVFFNPQNQVIRRDFAP